MAYEEISLVYDLLMKDVPYEEWVSFTEEHSCGNSVLDLGCGTGEIAVRLAQKGYDVTGVDLSEDMLAIANSKSSSSLNIAWIQQDIRKLEGLQDFDTVVSYFDVLNYVTTEEEIRNIFKQTFDILKPGGTFLFDVHSLVHLQEHMAGEIFAEVYDETTYIWFCEQSSQEDTFVHDLTFFIKKSDGAYTRFEEYHTQRGYKVEFLKKELQEAGFTVQAVYADSDRTLVHNEEDGDRLFFVCVKK